MFFETILRERIMNKLKMPILLFFLITIIFSAGCATMLSNKGTLVRVTNQSEDIKNCKFLGQVTSSSS